MSLDSFKMIDVLYSAGILKDDLSNYCYICHIQDVYKRQYRTSIKERRCLSKF